MYFSQLSLVSLVGIIVLMTNATILYAQSSWSEDDCALSACDCFPTLKLINCRNRGLQELDIDGLQTGYFSAVRILDLRANQLRDLPSTSLLLTVLPDLKIIQLADNPHLSCSQILAWRFFLKPHGVSVSHSAACDTTTSNRKSEIILIIKVFYPDGII